MPALPDLKQRIKVDADTTEYEKKVDKAEKKLAEKKPSFSGVATSLESQLSRSVDGLIIKGRSLENIFGNVRDSLTSTVSHLSIVNPIVNGLLGTNRAEISDVKNNGGLIGGFAKGASGLFSSLFSGFRALGGPVQSGRAYMVGEQGPEIFVPQTAGSVEQPRNVKNAAPIHINMNITTPNAQSFVASHGQISAQLLDAMRRGQRYR